MWKDCKFSEGTWMNEFFITVKCLNDERNFEACVDGLIGLITGFVSYFSQGLCLMGLMAQQ